MYNQFHETYQVQDIMCIYGGSAYVQWQIASQDEEPRTIYTSAIKF